MIMISNMSSIKFLIMLSVKLDHKLTCLFKAKVLDVATRVRFGYRIECCVLVDGLCHKFRSRTMLQSVHRSC